MRRLLAIAAAILIVASPARAEEDVFTRSVRFHIETGDFMKAEALVRNLEESGENRDLAARLRALLDEARNPVRAKPDRPDRPDRPAAPGQAPAAAAAIKPRNVPKSGRMKYVEALYTQGKTREVLLNLSELAATDPHAALLLGKLLYAEGKVDQAAGLFAGGLAQVDDAEGYFLAGLCARRLGRPDEARERFVRAAAFDPVSAAPPLAAGNLERALGRYEAARAGYLEALRRDPTLVEAHLGMADALDALGDEEEAVRTYTYILKTFPTGHDVCYLGLARVLFRKERFDDAIKLLDKARSVAPNNPQIQEMRSLALERKGDRKGAEASLRDALRLAPGNAALRERLIDLLLAKKAYPEAKEELKRALKGDPANGKANYQLGLLYSGEKEFRLADRHFQVALEHGYKPIDTVIALAILREAENRLLEAQAFYEKAMKLAGETGDTRYARLLRERVDSLGARIFKKDKKDKKAGPGQPPKRPGGDPGTTPPASGEPPSPGEPFPGIEL